VNVRLPATAELEPVVTRGERSIPPGVMIHMLKIEDSFLFTKRDEPVGMDCVQE